MVSQQWRKGAGGVLLLLTNPSVADGTCHPTSTSLLKRFSDVIFSNPLPLFNQSRIPSVLTIKETFFLSNKDQSRYILLLTANEAKPELPCLVVIILHAFCHFVSFFPLYFYYHIFSITVESPYTSFPPQSTHCCPCPRVLCLFLLSLSTA